MEPLKFPRSKNLILAGIALVLVIIGIIYFATLPVAEVAIVQRGTAVSAIYGTVRIEPTLVLPVRAQNAGFIQLAPELSRPDAARSDVASRKANCWPRSRMKGQRGF